MGRNEAFTARLMVEGRGIGVLWQNPRSGIADLVMDPSNPDKLFAAMWEFRREPGSLPPEVKDQVYS